MRTDLTLMQVSALRTMLADQYEDDERGWLDALEGETNALELASRLVAQVEAEEGIHAALTEQMEARKIRRDRSDARKSAARDAIAAVLKCAGLDKLALPEASLSLRETAAKLVLANKEAVPDEFCTMRPVPMFDKIKAAYTPDTANLPNWLTVEPARPSLTIRRK